MSEYIAVAEQIHRRWENELSEYGIIYIYAMMGYGKTVQGTAFAEKRYKESYRISASEENFVGKLEIFYNEHKKMRVRTLLILDDLQCLRDSVEQKKFFDILIKMLSVKPRIRIFILSRAVLPTYLAPLQVTKQLIVEKRDALTLDKDQLRELIEKENVLSVFGEEQVYSLVKKTLNTTKGYGLAVHIFLQRMMEYPNDENTAVTLAEKDIYNYMDVYLLSEWTNSRKEAVISLSVFQKFTMDMAEELLGTDAKEVINDFMSAGSFLTFMAPDNYSIVPFFLYYLRKKFNERPEKDKKELYERAVRCYDKQRNYEQMLRCYKESKQFDKIVELIVYLSENADGCSLAKVSEKYLNEIPKEWKNREPQLLGARVMLSAYRMKPEESHKYLNQLKELAEQEKKSGINGDALKAYMRTMIACPCQNSNELKENLILLKDYVIKYGIKLDYIMPTGNMPSLINGGLDLLLWEKNKYILYPIIKASAELIMGREAVGIADASMGEILYEQNLNSKAMARLTKALSAANLHGSIRTQYAITGIMARIFTSEEQLDTAIEILNNIRNKAKEQYFAEIIPNIEASIILCALYGNDVECYQNWIKTKAISEHDDFYITSRFQLLVKARVYITLGRDMDALYIIGMLQEYAISYKREYFEIELQIMHSIILFRRNEEWQELLLDAVTRAYEYGLVRVFADQGAALLPLWKSIKWDEISERVDGKYIKTIGRELKHMSVCYPKYLKAPRHFASLTHKELVVLRYMAEGLNNTQIANKLELNLGTIKFHVKNIMTKLEAENRTVAVKIAQEKGIL